MAVLMLVPPGQNGLVLFPPPPDGVGVPGNVQYPLIQVNPGDEQQEGLVPPQRLPALLQLDGFSATHAQLDADPLH